MCLPGLGADEEEGIDRTAAAAAVDSHRRTAVEVVVDCIRRRRTAAAVVDYTRLLGNRLHRILHRNLVDRTCCTGSAPGLIKSEKQRW